MDRLTRRPRLHHQQRPERDSSKKLDPRERAGLTDIE